MRRFTLLLFVVLLALPATALAGKGALYVASYVEPRTAKKTDGSQHANVYVYKADGMQVGSGKGNGSWLPGQEIPVEAGEYWVGVGQTESRYNLHHYVVAADKTTVVETGWVSLATLPLSEQPLQDCAQHPATLRGYVINGDKRVDIISNDTRKPDAFGTIQLHVGVYEVEWKGMIIRVEVQAGKDYRIPTGFAGPSAAPEAYLLHNKDDDPGKSGVPICTDGAMHVIAGNYWVRELVIRNDGADVNYVTTEYPVEAEGSAGYSSLGSDRPGNTKSASSDDGVRVTVEQAKGLASWGKKQSEFDDLDMFGTDPL